MTDNHRTHLTAIADAEAGVHEAQAALTDAVRAARADGVSWADIGAVLGTSRQAAFKRFGRPVDPRTRTAMRTTPIEPEPFFRNIFQSIDDGRFDHLAGLLDPAARRVLTRDAVLGTWAQLVAEIGNLTGVRDVRLVRPGTRQPLEDPRELGIRVVEGTVDCEAGECHGRVAVNSDGAVVGLLMMLEAPNDPEPF